MKMELVKIRDADGLMVLADEDGDTAEFEFLELYARGGCEYAVLLQKGDDMVTIMRFVEKCPDGKERYYPIEDDALFDELFRQFAEDFGDEFDFDE